MDPEAWVALGTVFVLGAMSPGPSLAVVLRNTMVGGRRQGVMTGIGHGIGFGIYAFLAAAGIATALTLHESTQAILKWGGIALLIWLGVKFLKASMGDSYDSSVEDEHGPSGRAGFAQGFAIAIMNPKIAAWMIALYAPFIEADISTETLFGMGLLGMAIDGTWYVTVATVLTRGDGVSKLRSQARRIDAAMGTLMFVFAGLLFGDYL
ncbi:MAG: LysE family translocator [Candidatus Thermoplasmatota archaeon]|nr:LysE family translocator [Candidatus Thermoplasmatota archaeon]|tara:strand:- start:193 stop:816 length:624 start_codon:yes stop_codon:yes gene_type:complete